MKLSLDKTWELCLEMWEYIASQTAKAKKQHKKKPNVETLKLLWLQLKDINYHDVDNHCFFCEYNKHRKRKINDDCWCPARLVDKEWTCFDKGRVFNENPIAFYNKLVELNKIRTQERPPHE